MIKIKSILISAGILVCIIGLTALILSLIPCPSCGDINLVNNTILK